MTTTFRADARAGLYSLAVGFAAANTSYGLATYRYRPAAFGDRPLVFVGSMSERVNYTGTTLRQRQMTPTLVFVWAPTKPEDELSDQRDDIIDGFLDYAGALPHAISDTTVTEPTEVEDVELELDGAFYPASIVSFGGTLALEGRA